MCARSICFFWSIYLVHHLVSTWVHPTVCLDLCSFLMLRIKVDPDLNIWNYFEMNGKNTKYFYDIWWPHENNNKIMSHQPLLLSSLAKGSSRFDPPNCSPWRLIKVPGAEWINGKGFHYYYHCCRDLSVNQRLTQSSEMRSMSSPWDLRDRFSFHTQSLVSSHIYSSYTWTLPELMGLSGIYEFEKIWNPSIITLLNIKIQS